MQKTYLQRQILAFIRANPSISYEILAQETGKAQSTIRRNIQKLKGLGFPELGVLGPWQPGKRIGPAIWLRCVQRQL